jgi:hypothetical protein
MTQELTHKERCKLWRERRISENKSIGGAPFGWDNSPDGTLVPNNEEQVTLQHIINMSEAGCTTYKIAKALNKVGAKTKLGGGWRPVQISRVLERAKSRGLINAT